jgi:hypothetical protein
MAGHTGRHDSGNFTGAPSAPHVVPIVQIHRPQEASMTQRTGISNRESPEHEAEERREHPPLDSGSPAPEDAAGSRGEDNPAANEGRHTSHKAGSRSIAQKESEARYPDRSMPPARKVGGAFGREPDGPSPRDEAATSKPGRHTNSKPQ